MHEKRMYGLIRNRNIWCRYGVYIVARKLWIKVKDENLKIVNYIHDNYYSCKSNCLDRMNLLQNKYTFGVFGSMQHLPPSFLLLHEEYFTMKLME